MKSKILALIVILCFWQFLEYFVSIGGNQSASPLSLFFALLDLIDQGDIFQDISASIIRVSIGFAMASLFAVSLAMYAASTKLGQVLINPLVEILRPIPPIAWIPISIIFFGLGNASSYFIVFLGAFFPIFSNTYLGVSSIPTIYRRVSETFELSRANYLFNVVFKYSLPYIFTGIRIGIGMAWMSVIASELVSGQSGLGYFIQINRLLLNLDNVIIGMVIIGFIGFIFNEIFLKLEALCTPWRKYQ